MELINLTTSELDAAGRKIAIEKVPDYLSITVKDIMYRAMDGEVEPLAVKHYLDTIYPKYKKAGVILPFIKDRLFMNEFLNVFSGIPVWIVKGDKLTPLRH